MSERQITREEAIERVELHLRGLWSKTTQEEAEEIVEAIGAWDQEDEIASNEWEWTDLKKTISREELWDLVGPNRWYGQGQRHDIARWEEDRGLVEATARALGYEVTEEEDKLPELPEGWHISLRMAAPVLSDRWVGVGYGDNKMLWCFEKHLPELIRALAALRQDDGEVELMVPLNKAEQTSAYDCYKDRTSVEISVLESLAVRARRVRP